MSRNLRRVPVPQTAAVRAALLHGVGVVLLILMSTATADAQEGWGEDRLGSVAFPVSCNDAARVEFLHAVKLLHHMTYPQARASFEKVATLDPACAMAHWGVAMTLFQPLWPTRPGPAELRRGREAVQAARALRPTAIALMTEAAELEASTPKAAVTPGPTLPAQELLGDLLMEQGQPASALVAYERALGLYPRRFNGLLGGARAARASGEVLRARELYRALLDVGADGDRTAALDEARSFLTPARVRRQR